ncbi:hypothetical protein GCM10008995_07500 [Halobellus salinus]|uniref:Uncharacterized protein n=1 Tax=Halobellus salinus TaxID=931585 RepID=A0A830E8M4_9EURY|nr:hypothetical protein GCM10008995_07500 [Halobellus salinus]
MAGRRGRLRGSYHRQWSDEGGATGDTSKATGPFHTVGYNYVKIFDTPGCRNTSRDYSRQYQSRLHGLANRPPAGAFEVATGSPAYVNTTRIAGARGLVFQTVYWYTLICD